MHSTHLVAKEFRGCFKEKFWFSVLILFYLEAIYLPVFKSLVHILFYEMWQINHLWLTEIYLYRFYIPELIQLANDAQTNPGPGIVDATKTIAAPYMYSQGNVEVFWYGKCRHTTITSSADLVQIMNIGNNMYSALSQSCKQGLLFLTDLPVMVNLSNINYQLTYSDGYSGLLNSALPLISLIADFPYVTSLLAAFGFSQGSALLAAYILSSTFCSLFLLF